LHFLEPTYSPPAAIELTQLIDRCIESERSRDLSTRSLFELRLHLGRFSGYCRENGISSFQELDAALLKDFILHTNPSGSPAQSKAIIWTLRKFFSYLALWDIVPSNPARLLSHPKIAPRHKLPRYLTAAQLRTFMTTAAESNSLQDFVVVSLLATTGARPSEIVNLRMRDINCGQQFIFLHVKGNWYKRTPVSAVMADLLEDYLESLPQTPEYLFHNQWDNPIDVRYIQRLVRHVGEAAGLSNRITPVMLRHTFATHAADRHGIMVTRALLGHCAASHATDVYLHLVPGKFRRLMNCHPYQTTIDREGTQ
jgi:site-specific recombinase XerD